jgi:hypothetical protein
MGIGLNIAFTESRTIRGTEALATTKDACLFLQLLRVRDFEALIPITSRLLSSLNVYLYSV